MAIWRYTEVAPDLTGFITEAELENGLARAIIDAYNTVAAALGLGTLTAIPTNGSVTAAMLAAGFQIGADRINGVLDLFNLPTIPQNKVSNLIADIAQLDSEILASISTAYNNVATALGLGSLTAIPTNGSVTNASLSNLFELAQSKVAGLSTSLVTAANNAISDITTKLGLGTLTAVPKNNSVSLASLAAGFLMPQSNINGLLSDLSTQLNFTKVVRDAVAKTPNATDADVINQAQYIGNLYGYAATNIAGPVTPGTGGVNPAFSYFNTEVGENYTWQLVNSGRHVVLPGTGVWMILANVNWSNNAIAADCNTTIQCELFNSSHTSIGILSPATSSYTGGTSIGSASPTMLVSFTAEDMNKPGFSYAAVRLFLRVGSVGGAGRAVNTYQLTLFRLGDA